MALVAFSRHRLCCFVAPQHCVGLATKANQQHGRFKVNCHLSRLVILIGSEKVKEMKAAMEDGPDLGDFIAGVVPREGEGGYSGKLKLEKGEEIQST